MTVHKLYKLYLIHSHNKVVGASYPDGWDQYLDKVAANGDIPDGKRRRLTKAIQTLRRHLGEGWPSESKDTGHRILLALRNVSGSVHDGLLLEWSDSLSAIENVRGFDGILDRIKRSDLFGGAVAELKIAGRLARRGFLAEIGPGAGRKRPDLLVRDGDLELLVEVKMMGTAGETAKAAETEYGIIAACDPIFPSGIILKPLSGPHLAEVSGILKRESGRAAAERRGVGVSIRNVLNLYLVPGDLPGHTEMRAAWWRKQKESGTVPGESGGLCGPSDGVSEGHRTRIRIDRFARERQIPPEATGILVLAGQFLFNGTGDVGRFVDCIIERVYELRNVPAVVLVSTKFGEGDACVEERDDFVFARSQVYDWMWEEIVIVKNRFFEPGFDYERLKSMLLPG